MSKLKELSNKQKIIIIGILIVMILGGAGIYLANRPAIIFKENNVKVEINDKFNAPKNIIEVRGGKVKDVKIDTSKINYQKLGEYPLVYTFKDKAYNVMVEVVDTKKPKFEIVDLDLDLGMKVDPKAMVKNIKDDTKTKVAFKKEYQFVQEGTVEVVIQVIDEAGNIAEKKGHVKLVKDSDAPTIHGIAEMSVVVKSKVDFSRDVIVKDNRDPEPKLDIDTSKVDLNKIGKYKVKYTACDRSGNKVTRERTVNVIKKPALSANQQSDEKIVYLTFDDGPSENTAKVLEILDRYNVKATFFVTGTNQKYNYLIKQAHDKGHTIGLHTYSHDYQKIYTSVEAYFDDLYKVDKMVKDLTGVTPKYIRFPGGASNTVSRKYCAGIMSVLSKEVVNRGYQYYDWNGDSTDASGNNVPVSKLIANATSSKANNINILFHDTRAKSTTVQALPAIIENYLSRGYRFEAISDDSFVPHQGINN